MWRPWASSDPASRRRKAGVTCGASWKKAYPHSQLKARMAMSMLQIQLTPNSGGFSSIQSVSSATNSAA